MADRKKPWEMADEEKPDVRDDGRERGPWSSAAAEVPRPTATYPPPEPPRPTRSLFAAPWSVQPNTSSPIWPVSHNAQGKAEFDTNAGVLGAIKRAGQLVGDVYEGRVDPRSDEGIKRALEAATLANPLSVGATGGAAGRLVGGSRIGPQTPGARDLMNEGARDLGFLREAGVDYSIPAVGRMANDFIQQNITRTTSPDTLSVFQRLSGVGRPAGAQSVPYPGLQAARTELREIAGRTHEGKRTSDAQLAQQGINAIDDFIRANDPASLTPGSGFVPDMARRLDRGNANYAAGKRVEKIEDIGADAALAAARANSGSNVGNSIRQGVSRQIRKKGGMRGFTEAEEDLASDLVQGNWFTNRARGVANRLGGGGGRGSFWTGVGGGATGLGMTGDPFWAAALGLGAVGTGFGLKQAENAMVRRGLNQFQEAVAQRSPLFEERAAANAAAPGMYALPPGRGALAGAMVGSSAFGPQPTFTNPTAEALAMRAIRNQQDLQRRMSAGDVI